MKSDVLTSSLILEEVFDTVMKLIGDYFSPRNWSLLLVDKKTERLKFEIVMGIDASKLDKVYLEKGEGIAGWVCETGQPAIVELDIRHKSWPKQQIAPQDELWCQRHCTEGFSRMIRGVIVWIKLKRLRTADIF